MWKKNLSHILNSSYYKTYLYLKYDDFAIFANINDTKTLR